MKRKVVRKKERFALRSKTPARRTARRPRNVYQALRKLISLTNQMQARAAELEHSLQVLREQERMKIMKDLLSALRDTPAGNLVAAPPDRAGENGPDATAQGMLEALMATSPIRPVHNIGDRMPVGRDHIPDTVDLDRPIGDYLGECRALEVTSVGWSYDGKVLLKPIARPVIEG
jgi:hypothetical protein